MSATWADFKWAIEMLELECGLGDNTSIQYLELEFIGDGVIGGRTYTGRLEADGSVIASIFVGMKE